jgi:hypothetical protein
MGQFHEILSVVTYSAEEYSAEYEGGKSRKELFDILSKEVPEHATIIMTLLDGKIYEAYQAIWHRIRPVGRESETFRMDGQGE